MRNNISIIFLVSAFLSAFFSPNAEAVDGNPPLCSFDATSGRGTATDNRPSEDTNGNGELDFDEDVNGNGQIDQDTGIFSVALDPGSTNLILSVDAFELGAGVVGYTVTASDATTAGTGNVIATDGAGNTCIAPVQIDPSPPPPPPPPEPPPPPPEPPPPPPEPPPPPPEPPPPPPEPPVPPPPPPVPPPPNNRPTASSVFISGNPRVGQVLTGNYTYDADAEGDLQGASTFRWLRDNVAIAGATARSYALVAADEGALIRFEITPVAQSGTSPGLAVTSPAVGPVTPAPNDRPTVSDLELISLTATPEFLTVNGQLTYTITVRNNGPAAATGVHVIDALPPVAVPAGGLADSSQGQCSRTPSPGPQPQALTVRCDLETLAPSAEATVTINVMPTVAGDLPNTARVAALETDPDLANNSKTETTTVEPEDPAMADLAITATVGPRASDQGFTYTLTVTNNGLATATGVQLTNDLPRDNALEQIIRSQGSCGDTSGTDDPVLCDLGALPTGAAATVTIHVIRTEVEPDTLPNRAAVNGDQHDPIPDNNFALTSALELPRPQTACNSTRCTLTLTCNGSDLLERRCDNQVITVFVDTRARRDTRAGRLSGERAARPPGVRFAAAAAPRDFQGDQTPQNVRLRLTSKGKKLARTLIRQRKKKVKGVMQIRNHVGGTDFIPLTVRLK